MQLRKLTNRLLYLLVAGILLFSVNVNAEYKYNPLLDDKFDYYDANTDTTYTAGDALTLTGTDFDFDGGAAPGNELGGVDWANPTVDSIHSGSAHHSAVTITTPDAEVTVGQAITFADTGIMGITESGDTITFDATEVDGSISNEFNTIQGDDNTPTSGLAISIDGAGIVTTDVIGDILTVTGTEVDSLSLHLDQTTPQTLINGVPLMTTAVAGGGSVNQVTNKAYVDFAVSSLHLSEFFSNAALSPAVGTFLLMEDIEASADTVQSVDITGTIGSPTAIFKWLTSVDHPHLDRILAGTFDIHVHLLKTTGAPNNKLVAIYAEVWQCDAAGAHDTQIATSATTTGFTTSDAFYDIYATVAVEFPLAVTDRISVEWFGYVLSGSGTNQITMTVGGTADSHLEISVNSAELRDIFVPYIGAEFDVDLGAKNFVTTGTLGSGVITGDGLILDDNETIGWGGDESITFDGTDFQITDSLDFGTNIWTDTLAGYVDQDVQSGTTPTFTATNITGVPAASILTGTFGTGGYVMDTSLAVPIVDTPLIQDAATIHLRPSGDADDYVTIKTATNISYIGRDDDDDLIKLESGAVTIAGTHASSGYTGALTGEAATVATITGLAPDTQNTYSRTQYLIPYASTTTAWGQIAIGNDGEVLTSAGAGVAPAMEAIPTLNQNTTGTAANLSGTPALPNGTTATTQAGSDNSTKIATTAYVDAGGGGGETLAETLAIGADANDLAITSMAKLEGVDAQVYVDLGTNGKVILEADTEVEITSPAEITGLLTLTSGQIAFPASQLASGDANTLDDYEEGEYEPTLTCATSGSYTINAAVKTLAYTKIGRVVHVQGTLVIASENSPSGQLRLSVPLALNNAITAYAMNYYTPFMLKDHGDAGIENPYLYINGAASGYVSLVNLPDNGVVESIDETRVDTAFELDVNFTYIAA